MDLNIDNVLEKFGEDRIIALDVETTGMYKGGENRIIQIGVVEYDKKKKVREYCKLFGGGKSIPVCLSIHHITDEMRIGYPKFEECCDKLSKYLSGSIIVGHNVIACDMRLINGYMEKTGNVIRNYKTIDTYKIAKKVLPLKKFNLELCCKTYGISFGEHDALGDSKSSLMVLNAMIGANKCFEKEWFLGE